MKQYCKPHKHQTMRVADTVTESLFTMRHLDDFVSQKHPLCPVRLMVNQALKNIKPLLFADINGGHRDYAGRRQALWRSRVH